MAGIGSLVVGRHVFDMTNGWEGIPPAGEHLVVVSHQPRPDGWHLEAPFHFVDGVAAAVAKAKELAGERAPSRWRRVTSAGRRSRWAPWTRWRWTSSRWSSARASGTSGSVDGQHLLEDPDVVIRGDRVLHLRYRVRR